MPKVPSLNEIRIWRIKSGLLESLSQFSTTISKYNANSSITMIANCPNYDLIDLSSANLMLLLLIITRRPLMSGKTAVNQNLGDEYMNVAKLDAYIQRFQFLIRGYWVKKNNKNPINLSKNLYFYRLFSLRRITKFLIGFFTVRKCGKNESFS